MRMAKETGDVLALRKETPQRQKALTSNTWSVIRSVPWISKGWKSHRCGKL